MSNSDSEPATPEKRQKRLVTYNKKWETKFNWIRPSGIDNFSAKCCVCNNCSFTISHGGEYDVMRHLKSKNHLKNIEAAGSSTKISNFFATNSSKSENDVAFAEASYAYHSVIHSHSFLSAGCASSLFKGMFKDSNIASKYCCGRTKIGAIITKVLGPKSKEFVLKKLADDCPFSISTDASNKGNIKTFPLVIRYFDLFKGVQTALIAFFSLEAEDTATISNALKKQLNRNNLSLSNVSAYGADNANINFGNKNSVFTTLKKDNENIVPAGCNLHIIHNTAKKACYFLKIDVEAVIIKIFNEFSSSTKKTTELKEFFVWSETEWCEMLRHVPTRWLTLLPAIERLLLNFKPIKSYFMSKNSVAPSIRMFFDDELAEAYLGFVMNACSIFQPALKKLQGNELLILDIYIIMDTIRQSLIERKNDNFYGFIANKILHNCDNESITKRFKIDANNFFDAAIKYIEKWFDFNDKKLKILCHLNLRSIPEFQEIKDIVAAYKIYVNEDLLYEEYVFLKKFIRELGNAEKELPIEEKWILFFKKFEAPNITKIVQVIFSIPHSNAISERIFSLMTTAWRKERNRLLLENLEAELMVKQNFGMNCIQFQNFLKEDDSILKDIKSKDKYH